MTTRTCTTVDDVTGLRPKVGQALGTSAWRLVDQASIDTFARVTGDEQWIHTDPLRAASGPFGTTVAHGFLTLSLCSSFLEEALTVHGASMAVNYGLDRVRFPSPVPAGTRVRGAVELISLDDVPDAVQAVIRVTVEIEGRSKPGCVADLVVRFYRE